MSTADGEPPDAVPPDSGPPDGTPAPGPPDAGSRRGLTVGLVLGVTVMAFGGLAVVTIAPRLPADLGGLELYGWVFSAYLLASLLGTVWAGAAADRSGPSAAFALGLGAFALGSALAALAPSMAAVVAARTLQGAGGGAVITCIYVALSLAYPDRERPRLLAYLSSAWVVPALVGPAVAGLVAELASWRWVFGALVPLPILVAVLTLPAFGRLRRRRTVADGRRRLADAVLLALAVGAGLWALGTPGAWYLRLPLALTGILVARRALGRLLPARTLRLGPGLGAIVAGRGLFFAAFITVEVYLALMLTDVLGLSSAVTGIVIATGAVSWTVGSWTQARLDARAPAEDTVVAPGTGRAARPAGGPLRSLAASRERRVQVGVAVLGTGLATQLVALALVGGGSVLGVPVALLVAGLGWAAAGGGIGFAHATSSALALGRAEREGVEPGTVSAGLLLADNVASAVATGVGGALLAAAAAAGAGLGVGVALGYGAGYAALALSAAASLRIGWTAPAAPRTSAPG